VRAHDGRPLIADTLYVYPTALKAESVLRERARSDGCLLGHRVTTFPELTDALARDLGVTARVLAPELAAFVLARVLDAPGTPAAFREPRRGLVRELLRVVDELKAAYLSPPDVHAVAAALPRGPAAVRLEELATVYEVYEKGLARLGAVDRHGREWAVCEGLEALEARGETPAGLRGVGRIVFAEIYDYSVLQFLIATSLIRIVGDAELIAFAQAENVDATRFLERTWNRFVGDPAIADQVLPTFVERSGRRGSIAAALRGVFAVERPPPAPGDGSIRLVVAPSRYGEVEAAVRDVRRRLDAGEPAERLALLARDLAVYGDLIENVCRRYRVPVYFRKGKPLLANGLVKSCLNVLRCASEGFLRARLEGVLDSDYFTAGRPRLVRALRRAGFVAQAARPLADCLAHRAATLTATAADASQPAERRTRAAEEAGRLARDGDALLAVVETVAALDRRRSVAGHVRVMRTTLRRLGLRVVPRDADLGPTARRDVRAWERLDETLGLLAGLAGALGVEPLGLHDFLGLLLAALEPLEVEDPAERSGSIRALSVLDARGLDFDTVYLLGLDDGTFPAPHPESPLWPDAMKRAANGPAALVLRRKLGARGAGLPLGGLLRTAREASLEDPFLFFLALSMAEQRVVVSYPSTNEKGNPTVASPFVDELRACSAEPLPETRLDATAVVPAADECCELAELVGRAALGRWARDPGVEPDRLSAALAEDPSMAERLAAIDGRGAVEERRTRYFLTPAPEARRTLADCFVGHVPSDPLLAERVAAMRWSPHRLDALGTCGFKFFARHLLGLEDAEDPETEVDLRERGTLVHAALEGLFRAHPVLPADLDAARALARGFAEEVRARAARAIAAKDPSLLAVAWQQVTQAIDELIVLEHDAQRRLAAAGVTIERILETPLACRLGESLVVEGTPDRVDVHRRSGAVVGVEVLDYKMSANRSRYLPLLDPAKQLGRSAFQVPVYLLGALARVGAIASDAVLRGGYLLLRAEGRDKEVLRPMSPELLDGVAGRIADLVGGASGGRFDVDPEPCDPYCAYRGVCRYQRPPLEDEAGDG
jgi:hypothetical protein